MVIDLGHLIRLLKLYSVLCCRLRAAEFLRYSSLLLATTCFSSPIHLLGVCAPINSVLAKNSKCLKKRPLW